MDPIRIWYQSYVDEPNGKVYWDRLRRHLAAIADPGTTGRHHQQRGREREERAVREVGH